MRLLSLVTLATCLVLSSPASAGTFSTGGPSSTNNDDTCDIGLFPSATLLLPFFDVDVDATPGAGETTIFSITNVDHREQIALVTLWSDYGYPVLSFNIYLTGYDVQSINLYDVIVRGQIAPPRGTGTRFSPVGEFSVLNPEAVTASCSELPGTIPQTYVSMMREAFTTGKVRALDARSACDVAGSSHNPAHAFGYVTVDVVHSCSTFTPADHEFYTNVIAYDNVLVGDWMQVERTHNYAEGNPMVHIRAIPEGGRSDSRAFAPNTYRSNFPQTFYGRFSGVTKSDGRQPLPSRFATRWIEGGSGSFQTSFTIWREPKTGLAAACTEYSQNGSLPVTEYVAFDEDENANGLVATGGGWDPPQPEIVKPATSRVDLASGEFPYLGDAVGGWMYVNLDDPNTSTEDAPASQGWVTTTFRAESRHSVSFDAIAMGNGCTPASATTQIDNGTTVLGPSSNPNP